MKFEPVLDNLIIQPIEEPKMAGAVVLPDTAVDKPCKAKVIAVGTRQSMDIDEAIDAGELSGDEDMPESHLIKDERNKKVYDSLKKLNADYATALYLTYYEDMKVEEISRVMHKTVKQVYNLLSRGKASLRELLSDEDL